MCVEVKRPVTAPEKSRFTVLALASGVLLFWGLQVALCWLGQAGFVWVEGVLMYTGYGCQNTKPTGDDNNDGEADDKPVEGNITHPIWLSALGL